MRLILYTGKGGVGKSSIAAATAVRTAEFGRRTLLVSSDLAHNLSDIFGAPVGNEPLTVAGKLTALEVDALKEIRENWTPAQDYFANLLAYLGIDDAVAEEVALLPGMDELFVFTRILQEVESGRYDVVIVDCSPTAGTLRHLTLTDTACTKLQKMTEMKRRAFKLLRPLLNRVQGIRHFMAGDEVFDVFDHLLDHVSRLGALLKKPDVSSVRLVLNADRVAIAETRRAFTYFGLFGFPVDGIFVNKVLPPELADGYMNRWFTLQQQLLTSIDQSFLDVTKFRVPLLGREPIGPDSLAELASGIFGERQPDEVLSATRSVAMDQVDGKQRLVFRLQNVNKKNLDVGRKGGELILSAANYTRVFSLPDTLMDREITGAQFADGTLAILFD